MCGIVGYTGSRQCCPILLKGLQRLEYRGYDSAGLAIADESRIEVVKEAGKIQVLAAKLKDHPPKGTTGIGHTRWATHGSPSFENAHPHFDCSETIIVVHNGIIENAETLRVQLLNEGHQFKSETDTEVLAHLIESCREKEDSTLEAAVANALRLVEGTYGLAVMSVLDPHVIVGARKGSPLIVGLGRGEHFLASDVSAILEHTRDAIYLGEGELVVLTPDNYRLFNLQEKALVKEVEHITWELDEIETGGYTHYMEKEIFEQPNSVAMALRRRIDPRRGEVYLDGLNLDEDELKKIRRITLTGCGTSWHAALIGEYLIEQCARISVDVDYASELRYRKPVLGPHDVVIGISQSGETADTLAAMREARALGSRILAICNVVGSTIAREADGGIYIHAGPEIGVASTKAFTGQVTVLSLLAILLGRSNGTMSHERATHLLKELNRVPELMAETLAGSARLMDLASSFGNEHNALYLGRGINFPVALEGALKLKEISYIHAEGYPAAEMKHGPIALIDEKMPVIFLATRGPGMDKILSNMSEVRARKGRILAVVTEGDELLVGQADQIFSIPDCDPLITPLLSIVPLQLLAYYVAVLRGCDVDQPRNLAKSVTVE
ncbi:MAG: glutamine--fructose-6-phosphate transaminase (isomerizing) [Candidatus Eisenbacteria bacterium]|uniref:Glutamine--fructose-6-phosphate aminotransferase [isomerizing] n=1 Tax=Eiseniibacteriota bacterium TaxID=2212470 RepID=A0A948WE51_UNCEI|nr:glutamine--fructose-6-phosphate transaminase (isomerizing) [Candidatus Eisenbacteria bacterium]MBU1947366.1 glutamine--fructose-6-phosphate transaminase (isomerizing) [Candidatus Eisenbacteria bacterium]MBU2692453.1 glutamine--fructose-6-phosphate transaminase (isomerizing) [Candidatus Eisenbacteria bacterium]